MSTFDQSALGNEAACPLQYPQAAPAACTGNAAHVSGDPAAAYNPRITVYYIRAIFLSTTVSSVEV